MLSPMKYEGLLRMVTPVPADIVRCEPAHIAAQAFAVPELIVVVHDSPLSVPNVACDTGKPLCCTPLYETKPIWADAPPPDIASVLVPSGGLTRYHMSMKLCGVPRELNPCVVRRVMVELP